MTAEDKRYEVRFTAFALIACLFGVIMFFTGLNVGRSEAGAVAQEEAQPVPNRQVPGSSPGRPATPVAPGESCVPITTSDREEERRLTDQLTEEAHDASE